MGYLFGHWKEVMTMNYPDATLTTDELTEITEYTMMKINSYPKRFGKTVENYFVLLFPDEINNYIFRKEMNRKESVANV